MQSVDWPEVKNTADATQSMDNETLLLQIIFIKQFNKDLESSTST